MSRKLFHNISIGYLPHFALRFGSIPIILYLWSTPTFFFLCNIPIRCFFPPRGTYWTVCTLLGPHAASFIVQIRHSENIQDKRYCGAGSKFCVSVALGARFSIRSCRCWPSLLEVGDPSRNKMMAIERGRYNMI